MDESKEEGCWGEMLRRMKRGRENLLPLLLPLTSAPLVLSFPHDLFPMFSLITMLVTILSVQYRLSLGDHQSLWPGKDAYRTGGIE